MNVDRIYVLKDGKINDQGTHAELVQREGFFKTMWDKQQGDPDGTPPSPTVLSTLLLSPLYLTSPLPWPLP